MHYCMGELADWAIGHNDSETCGKCGMDKTEGTTNDCCKDESRIVKHDAHQKAGETAFQFLQALALALPPQLITFQADYFPAVTEENPMSHAPPEPSHVAVYIRNCTFLI